MWVVMWVVMHVVMWAVMHVVMWAVMHVVMWAVMHVVTYPHSRRELPRPHANTAVHPVHLLAPRGGRGVGLRGTEGGGIPSE